MNLCDDTLLSVIDLFGVTAIMALGRYAESRAKKVLFNAGKRDVQVHFMVHPSPASAVANRGWDALALDAFEKANLTNLIEDGNFVK